MESFCCEVCILIFRAQALPTSKLTQILAVHSTFFGGSYFSDTVLLSEFGSFK